MIRARVFPIDLVAQADRTRWESRPWAWEVSDPEVPTKRVNSRPGLIDWGYEAVAEAYYAVTMLRLVAPG